MYAAFLKGGNVLILTRLNETLWSGAEITGTVLGVKGKQVRGVYAPKHVDLYREGFFERIALEKQTSNALSGLDNAYHFDWLWFRTYVLRSRAPRAFWVSHGIRRNVSGECRLDAILTLQWRPGQRSGAELPHSN